jgi:hypothetical protein
VAKIEWFSGTRKNRGRHTQTNPSSVALPQPFHTISSKNVDNDICAAHDVRVLCLENLAAIPHT